MRRVGGWSIVALVSFGVLVAIAEAVLKAVHVHWPQGVLVGLGALAGALVGLVKPLQDAVTTAWSKALSGRFERVQQRDELRDATAPGRKQLQQVKDLHDARSVLGIHTSIPLPNGDDSSLSRELPLYVPRDIHATVTTWITAHEQTGGFLLLLGPAGAGKTRCLYEALRERVPDAPILLPTDAAQLQTFVSTVETRRGPVVIWLNEIYDFLGAGQLTADLIRRALNHTRPLLLVATMWRERYEALAAEQDTSLNRDAYEILNRLGETEDLSKDFTPAELDRARQLSTRDPRLREALASLADGSTDITGTLAAKPRLIARYGNTTNPYERAILTAAITATHLGHPDPIPETVLEPLALNQLDPGARAAVGHDWFRNALPVACSSLPGLATAPLEPRAETPGRIDGYRAHDILTQTITPPLTDRDITTLVKHATPISCLRIGATLHVQHGKTNAAITATRKALEKPESEHAATAAVNLGILLAELGDTDGARNVYQQAIDTQHPDEAPRAAFSLGYLLKNLGDTDGARNAYQTAIDTQHPDHAPKAAFNLGNLLKNLGDTDGARNAYQTAIDTQHPDEAPKATVNLGNLLKNLGDTDGARNAYQQAIDTQHPDEAPKATVNLGNLLAELGDTDGARNAYQTAIDTQHPEAAERARQALEDLDASFRQPIAGNEQ